MNTKNTIGENPRAVPAPLNCKPAEIQRTYCVFDEHDEPHIVDGQSVFTRAEAFTVENRLRCQGKFAEIRPYRVEAAIKREESAPLFMFAAAWKRLRKLSLTEFGRDVMNAAICAVFTVVLWCLLYFAGH